MPLNYQEPKIKNTLINRIRKKTIEGVDLIAQVFKPEIILITFLFVSILLSFLKIRAVGFFIVFGIYIICYFAERVVKQLNRNKE